MVDLEENKLFDRPSQPENRHSQKEKMAQSCGAEFFPKEKTGGSHKDEKVDQPDVGYLHNGLIERLKILKIRFPPK
jgi:hypothetical protein